MPSPRRAVTGDALPREAEGRSEAGEYRGSRGVLLRYCTVRARPERHALVYLHGIESHAGWFLPAAEALCARGYTTYLLDRRGSGVNRELGAGDAPSADALLEDVQLFREHLADREHSLVGLSWGGKLALACALARPEGLRGLVLVTPGLVPRVDLDPGRKLRLLASLAFGGRAPIQVPIEPEMFTSTPHHLEFIRRDPLRLSEVTARFLLASWNLDRRIRRRVADLRVPTLLFLAGHDRIVDNARTRALLTRARPDLIHVREYRHATHSIQLDDTGEMADDVHRFLEAIR